jgi:hypothetical protein
MHGFDPEPLYAAAAMGAANPASVSAARTRRS